MGNSKENIDNPQKNCIFAKPKRGYIDIQVRIKISVKEGSKEPWNVKKSRSLMP